MIDKCDSFLIPELHERLNLIQLNKDYSCILQRALWPKVRDPEINITAIVNTGFLTVTLSQVNIF